MCGIPEDADLELKLPVNSQSGAVDPADAALFTAARSDLPSAQFAATTARIEGDQLVIALGKEWGATLPQIKSLTFFPYDEGGIEYAAPQTLTRNQDGVELAMKVGYQPPKPGMLRGVLLATEQSGNDFGVVPMEIAASLSGTGGSQPKGSPRFAPAGGGTCNGRRKKPRLRCPCCWRSRSWASDPELDALRVPGAVDQSHRSGGTGQKASRRRTRQGAGVRRGRHQLHAPPSRPCF